MRKYLVLLMSLLLLISLGAVAQAPEDRARFAAEQWIVLVDDGQYSQSWKEASKMFQTAVPSEEWEKKVQAERAQLGPKQSRKLKDIKSTTAVKGLPGGQYIQVKYQSSYEKKKIATETITAVLEPDGAWRVVSYTVN
jgi:opacity protein-like surface antigen